MYKLLILVSLASLAVFANFDDSRVFIELKANSQMPDSALIKNSKHLFKNIYAVSTTSVVELEKELKNNSSIKRIQRNFKSNTKMLPVGKRVSDSFEKAYLNFESPFNDPENYKVWAFRDAAEHGVSVDLHYLTPLSREKVKHVVAVVDTGVDYNHEDLKSIMWKNKKEIAGNGIDDDDNGYIDDVFGIDTLNRNEDGQASGNPMASHAHGTHVSGTIAAAQNNLKGIAGLSSSARIMAIRTVPDAADETDIDIVESFIYAAKHGAKLINCSFGKRVNEGGDIVNETITFIGKEYGVLTVAAAGNESSDNDRSPKYPASFDSDYLLVVASTNKRGSMSYFSNYGKETVDIAAPGSDVYSTVPGNDYQNMSGTSMAAPTTVGVASEVLGIFPELGPLRLKEVLMKSSTQIGKFKNKTVSGGRVDLANAVKYTLENYINL